MRLFNLIQILSLLIYSSPHTLDFLSRFVSLFGTQQLSSVALAMPRYKKTTTRVKDPSRFHSYNADDKFEEFIELRKILEEKGFQFLQQPSGTINTIYAAAANIGWLDFCTHPRDPVLPIVKEFYSNMLQQDQHTIMVRNVQVSLNSRVINAFYNLPSDIDYEC